MSSAEDIMRPKIGDSKLVIPITFDYQGGRREKLKSKKLWSGIIAILGLIVGFGIMFNKGGFFLTNFLLGAGVIYGSILVIRYPIMKEKSIRKVQDELEESDYEKDTKEVWGIFSIDDTYPYYCRFKNGLSGLFVYLNKDVILGKYNESEHEHYEALSDAYNLIASSGLRVCHVDYMDFVGSDDRLDESFASLGEIDNTDVRDVLTDVYSYSQAQMNERLTTADVYAFMWKGSDVNAWKGIQDILSCMLDANFVNYHIMNINDLRSLNKTIMNLHNFSARKAMAESLNTHTSSGVLPIRIIKEDGRIKKLGRTSTERESERKIREREEELKKQEVKRRKENYRKRKKEDEEQIDLF